MKTVAPFRLGVLTRPYRWQRENMLGMAVIALINLGEEPRLMSEQELWELMADEADPGCVLDLGIPKATPEMLATGYCYTAHQTDKTVCTAKLQVGDLAKSLTVLGYRQWLDGRPTDPRPFEKMRVDWRHAYGGPCVPENPLGIGTFDDEVDGAHQRRMPHVETPDAHVAQPGEHVKPAGFSAMPPDWPQRMVLIGQNFGESWQQNDSPGFAEDMDWRYFNAAAPDQRWPGRQELPPGAAYEICNMHPAMPRLQGHLPNWRARCFTSTEEDGSDLRETSLRLTTVWFFPHRERAVLIWHGATAIRDDDAFDVRYIMPALELPDEPRTGAHYQGVLIRRLDPETGTYALRDSDLVPKAIMGEWAAVESADATSRPMARNQRAGQLRDYEARRTELLARGLDPEKFLTPPPPLENPPPLDELPEYFERLSRDAEIKKKELQKKAETMMAKVEADTGTPLQPGMGAERDRFDPDKLIENLERLKAFARKDPAVPTNASPSVGGEIGQSAAQIRQGHLLSAHLSAPAPSMPSYRSKKIRRRLAQAAADQRNFAGMSLIGADLSGMDLRGADFSGAALEDANLNETQLDDCNFSRAVLARAKLSRASLRGAKLDHANLGGAQCEHSSFAGASFRDANCQKARFQSCNLARAVFERTNLHECTLIGCDLRQSTWCDVALMKMKLEDIAFGEAIFERVAWVECELSGVSFAAAQFKQCGFITTDCSQQVNFSRAMLTRCSFAHGSSLASAAFRDATLKECGLRAVSLTRADLSGASFDCCDFSECNFSGAKLDHLVAGASFFTRADFTGASLRGANMIDAMLSKAVLSSADLDRANLFRADLSQAFIDAATRLDGTYTHRAQMQSLRSGGPHDA